jgi:hypothetical protein
MRHQMAPALSANDGPLGPDRPRFHADASALVNIFGRVRRNFELQFSGTFPRRRRRSPDPRATGPSKDSSTDRRRSTPGQPRRRGLPHARLIRSRRPIGLQRQRVRPQSSRNTFLVGDSPRIGRHWPSLDHGDAGRLRARHPTCLIILGTCRLGDGRRLLLAV